MDGPETSRRRPPSRAVSLGDAALVGVYGLLLAVLAWPVLTSPIWGDDIHWLLETTPRSQGTPEGWWRWTVARPWAPSPDQGRFVQAAYVVQRAVDHMTLSTSVVFGMSPVVVRAVLKATLLALNVVALAALLRQIRVAVGAGAPRTVTMLSPATRRVILLAFPLVVLAGAKATLGSGSDANGWLDYPLLTYGGAVLMLVVVAGFLRALRSWERWRSPKRAAFQLLAVALGPLLVITYELYYLVVPAVAVAVMLQGSQYSWREARWWRLRAIVTLPFFAGFTTVFAYTRWYGLRACRETSCYDGLKSSWDDDTATAILRSVASAFPGGISSEVAAAREYTGAYAPAWPALGLVAALIGLGAVVVTWRLARAVHATPPSVDLAHAEQKLLIGTGLTAAGFGVAAAALTAVSARGQRELDQIGVAYRSGPMAWTLFSVALLCLGAAVVIWLNARGQATTTRAFLAVAGVGLAALTAVVWWGNIDAQRVDKSYADIQLVRMIHDEVVLGRTDTYADLDRCTLVARIYEAEFNAKHRMVQGAHESFMYFYDEPFCSSKTKDWATPFVLEPRASGSD